MRAIAILSTGKDLASLIGKWLTCLLAVSLLAACSYDDMLDKMAPQAEAAAAKAYLESVRLRNFGDVKAHLSSELLTPDIDAKLSEAAKEFPGGEPKAVKLIGAQVFTSSTHWQANLTYQYQFPQGWSVANVFLVRDGDQTAVIKGLHVKRLPASLEEMNAFTFQQKSFMHYIFLVLTIGTFLLIAYSLILCIRTPIARRKWLWVLVTLVGIGGFGINWTTGEILTQFAKIQLFGIGIARPSPYSPWIVLFSIPVGALTFLVKRKTLIVLNPMPPLPFGPDLQSKM